MNLIDDFNRATDPDGGMNRDSYTYIRSFDSGDPERDWEREEDNWYYGKGSESDDETRREQVNSQGYTSDCQDYIDSPDGDVLLEENPIGNMPGSAGKEVSDFYHSWCQGSRNLFTHNSPLTNIFLFTATDHDNVKARAQDDGIVGDIDALLQDSVELYGLDRKTITWFFGECNPRKMKKKPNLYYRMCLLRFLQEGWSLQNLSLIHI